MVISSCAVFIGAQFIKKRNIDTIVEQTDQFLKSDKIKYAVTGIKESITKSVQDIREPAESVESIESKVSRSDTAYTRTNEFDFVPKESQEIQNAPIETSAQWAVVKSTGAQTYNTSYRPLQTIPAGTLVDISEIRDVGKAELALCNVYYQDRIVSNILINTENLDIRPGRLDAANPKEKELRVKQAEIAAEIRRICAQRNSEMSKLNPYAEGYEAVKKAYNDYWAKVEDLRKKRDSAVSGDHVKYEDELRRMKGQDIKLAQDLKSAKSKFEEWNKKNVKDLSKDPEIRALKSVLSEVQTELQTIAEAK